MAFQGAITPTTCLGRTCTCKFHGLLVQREHDEHPHSDDKWASKQNGNCRHRKATPRAILRTPQNAPRLFARTHVGRFHFSSASLRARLKICTHDCTLQKHDWFRSVPLQPARTVNRNVTRHFFEDALFSPGDLQEIHLENHDLRSPQLDRIPVHPNEVVVPYAFLSAPSVGFSRLDASTPVSRSASRIKHGLRNRILSRADQKTNLPGGADENRKFLGP